MAAKCPACGFESADGAQWCDFCKEPFTKKKAAPSELPREALARIPAELLPGQDGETVPVAPRWLKPLAAAFLGLVALAAVTLTLVFVLKMRRLPR